MGRKVIPHGSMSDLPLLYPIETIKAVSAGHAVYGLGSKKERGRRRDAAAAAAATAAALTARLYPPKPRGSWAFSKGVR